MIRRFQNRAEAGRMLASKLQELRGRDDVLVLALPRGGVPVAAEVCRSLGLPLAIYVVRKLGVPGMEELAMGAIGPGGVCVLNEGVLAELSIPDRLVEQVIARERRELERRERAYRDDRPPPQIARRTIVLVDDGLATGATMRAAAQAVRQQGASRVVVAVPVAPPDVSDRFAAVADEVVCVFQPEPFYAIGVWYVEFPQVSDEEVRACLAATAAPESPARRAV